MNTNTKIAELLQVLADRGLNDEAIVNVRDGLWGQANEAFMDQVLTSLSDEDLQKVEAAANQVEANNTLKNMYQEKTGKDMQEEMKKIVDQYATELIDKYKVEDSHPVVSESYDSQTDSQNDAAPSASADTKEEETIHDLT
jgi:hypothetical protein